VADFANLGTLLKAKRLELGYTQAEVASKLNGLHVQIVSNWERGLCAPPAHCFHKAIDLLKVSRKLVEKAMVEDARQEIIARVYNSK
jgi:transcriptional regulator with XRE-family HTH domain